MTRTPTGLESRGSSEGDGCLVCSGATRRRWRIVEEGLVPRVAHPVRVFRWFQNRRLLMVGASLALALGALAFAPWAHAWPVRPGRYTEIPYGISDSHPWPTGHGDAARTGRSRGRLRAALTRRVWNVSLGAGRPSSPLIAADGSLLVANTAGVTSLTAAGAIQWVARLGFAAGTPSLLPTGQFAVWYPIKQRAAIKFFLRRAAQLPCQTILAVELLVRPDNSPLRMNGSGMLLINPPYRIDADLHPGMRQLAELLDDGGASFTMKWLKTENPEAAN